MERQLLGEARHRPAPCANGQLPGSLELAYLGDTVYDLYVRGRVLASGGHVKKLHAAASALVNAGAQSEALGRIEPALSEAEADVVRRARNAKQSPPRRADPRAYHRATGLEALIGYLYLMGNVDRIDELMSMALGS